MYVHVYIFARNRWSVCSCVCVCVYYFMCIQVYIEETERGRRKEEIEKRGGEKESALFSCVLCFVHIVFVLRYGGECHCKFLYILYLIVDIKMLSKR